eukprot:CAMPEP_0183711014 /NCGR_PEP_ID=MMETSP0737-20130205/6608_1 /TAXON_ID=385413 /ORGANISM="Thalassiosira miniscula, Strain CCMP1093" /LENGTH=104 /DNA_ID=CAMNT_0025939405 /DNA_START=613 /DNA_END=928 /DNA_ORIENTATION=+
MASDCRKGLDIHKPKPLLKAPFSKPESMGVAVGSIVGDAIVGDAVVGDAVIGDAVVGDEFLDQPQQMSQPHQMSQAQAQAQAEMQLLAIPMLVIPLLVTQLGSE